MINDDEIGEKEKSKTKKKYNCSKFRESIKYRPKQNKDSTKVKAFLKLFKTIKKSYFIFNKRLDMDFFLAVKNNVQKSEGAYSAGKVLIFILCLMKLLLEQGKHLRI